MRRYFNWIIAVTMTVLTAASVAFAQDSNTNAPKFDQARTFTALEKCLKSSDVPGFVEGALYTVVECKKAYPDLNYADIQEAVSKVEQENVSEALRYKAYLVKMYLTHSTDIQVAPANHPYNHDYLFKQIADQLEQKFLAFNEGENVVVGNNAR